MDAAAGIDHRLTYEPGTCHYLESATNILLIGPPAAAQVGDAAAAKPLAAAFQAGSVGVVGGPWPLLGRVADSDTLGVSDRTPPRVSRGAEADRRRVWGGRGDRTGRVDDTHDDPDGAG